MKELIGIAEVPALLPLHWNESKP